MDKLYKFVRSRKAVENLLAGVLAFPTTSELNDPCELLDDINRSAVETSLRALRKTGYTPEEFEWLKRQGALLQRLSPKNQIVPMPRSPKQALEQIHLSVYEDIDTMARRQRATVRNIRKACGILSLTSHFDSLPMWAHYADNACGFVVGFRHLGEVFQGDDTGVLEAPIQMNYTNEFVGMTFLPSTQNNLFFWKLSDWRYENEVRIISPLSACRKTLIENRELNLRNIPPKHVTDLIFGWKVPPETKRDLLDFTRSLDRPIDVYDARVNVTKVVLDPVSTI